MTVCPEETVETKIGSTERTVLPHTASEISESAIDVPSCVRRNFLSIDGFRRFLSVLQGKIHLSKQIVYLILLSCIFFSGLFLRFEGLKEGIHLHPDEIRIRNWMNKMYKCQEVLHERTMGEENVYAGGFFVLTSMAKSVVDHTVHKWNYYTRKTNTFKPMRYQCNVDFGRVCVALMGALVILFAAFTIRRVTDSRAAALFVAGLMAYNAYSIEHAHYLETDTAMLMTLTVSLYFIVLFLQNRNILAWIAAAFATGFSIGTKYPMAILLLSLFASLRAPSFCRNRSNRAKAVVILLMALAGILLVGNGFMAACPDASDLKSYVSLLQEGAHSVYLGTAMCIGKVWEEPFMRQWMNFNQLRLFSSSLPVVWLVLAAIGVVLSLRDKRYRRFWPILILCPFVYLYYFIFKAPWVRSQEFLPFVLLTAFLAAIPIARVWSQNCWQMRTIALLLVLLTLSPVICTGRAMASQFGWEDTRRLAARDMFISYPSDTPIGFEPYSNATNVGVTKKKILIPQYIKTNPEEAKTKALPPYLMRNIDHIGRGVFHPVTQKMYPNLAVREHFLVEKGICLGKWGVLESPAPKPTFRSPTMELWHLPETKLTNAPPMRELGIPLPRPVLVRDTMIPNGGRETIFKGALTVGGRKAMLIDRFPRQFALGGPGTFDNSPVYCVFTTHELGSTIVTKGFGQCKKATLPPYSAAVVSLQRPWWKPRILRYEYLEVHAKELSPYVIYLPCFLQVAFTPSDAAAILLDNGHPWEAADFLRKEGAVEANHPFWRAIRGEKESIPAAKNLLADWEKIVNNLSFPEDSVSENGIPMNIWQDFARIRLLPLEGAEFPDDNDLTLDNVLPVAHARQSLMFKTDMRFPEDADEAPKTIQLMSDNETLASFAFQTNVTTITTPLKEQPVFSFLRLKLSSSDDTQSMSFKKAELIWNWKDMLQRRIDQLKDALDAMESESAVSASLLTFGDLVAIQSIKQIDTNIELSISPLQGDLPPLAFQWMKRRHGHWRRIGTPIPLPAVHEQEAAFTFRLTMPSSVDTEKLRLAFVSAPSGIVSYIPSYDENRKPRKLLSLSNWIEKSKHGPPIK